MSFFGLPRVMVTQGSGYHRYLMYWYIGSRYNAGRVLCSSGSASSCLRLQRTLHYARLGLAPTHIARPSIVTYNEDLYTSWCLSVCWDHALSIMSSISHLGIYRSLRVLLWEPSYLTFNIYKITSSTPSATTIIL